MHIEAILTIAATINHIATATVLLLGPSLAVFIFK